MNVSLFCIMLALDLLYIVLIMMLCFFYLSFQYFYMERMLNPMFLLMSSWDIFISVDLCVMIVDNTAPCFKLWNNSDKNTMLLAKKKYSKNKTNKTKPKQKWKALGNNGMPRHKAPNSTACHWSRYLSCHAISFSPCFLVAMNLAVTWNYTTNQLLSPISCFDNGNLLQQHK